MLSLFQYDWHGNIAEVIEVPNAEFAQSWPGWTKANQRINVETEWYDMMTGEIKPRSPWEPQVNKTTINADGVDELIISGLPVGTQVAFGTNKYTVNDGEFVLTTVAHGTGYVRIVPPGKQIRTVVFNALEL